MRRKLLRRTRKQKGELSLRDLENIERRAGSAYAEMRYACEFLACPGDTTMAKDSDNWNAFPYPLARRASLSRPLPPCYAARLPDGLEHWDHDLLALRFAQDSTRRTTP